MGRVIRGRWSESPLREAKFLAGVLSQQGLAGKGLIDAFQRWAPKLLGYTHCEISALFQKQTGKPLSDTLLLQQAYTVVRREQLPPEADVFRKQIMGGRLET